MKKENCIVRQQSVYQLFFEIFSKNIKFEKVERFLIKIKTFDTSSIQFIDIYKITIKFCNNIDKEYVFTQMFYIFFKIVQNIIVKLL